MAESKRQIQKNKTRQHIIDTAMECFCQNGISGVSTLQIAQAAGISHGSIFAHFETKDALLDAVIEDFGHSVNLRLHQLAQDKRSLYEALKAHLDGVTEYERFYTVLISQRSTLKKSAGYTLTMINSAASFHIGQAAEAEMKAGKIKEMPVYLLFNTWMALIDYYLINRDLFSPEEPVLKRHGDMLLNHFLNLIKI